MKLDKRLEIKGRIRFETAFHIGSGSGGAGASDMGVLLDHGGQPVLPGSSLKGVFRSTAEALAEHLGASTCFLDKLQKICAGGNEDLAKDRLEKLSRASAAEIDQILSSSLCDTCRLFGSVLSKGKIRFSDAPVLEWAGALEIRDGVGIDRDSGTAVPRVKYDYEAVPAGASFAFTMTAENLTEREQALVFVVLGEWQRRFHLGGMTSRGFGAARLVDVELSAVDFSEPDQRLAYLLDGTTKTLDAAEVRHAVELALEGLDA